MFPDAHFLYVFQNVVEKGIYIQFTEWHNLHPPVSNDLSLSKIYTDHRTPDVAYKGFKLFIFPFDFLILFYLCTYSSTNLEIPSTECPESLVHMYIVAWYSIGRDLGLRAYLGLFYNRYKWPARRRSRCTARTSSCWAPPPWWWSPVAPFSSPRVSSTVN